jgi:hypothetical protein
MAKFHYSVLRFVPEPASGEFVNMGAIVGCEESQEWSYRIVGALTRVNGLARIYERDAGLAINHAQRLCKNVDDYNASFDEEQEQPRTALSAHWLGDQADKLNHVLQLSEPGILIAPNAALALDMVFETMVPSSEARTRATDKRVATKAARDAFSGQGLVVGEHVFPDLHVVGQHHPSEFDLAVANGKLVQLVQTWSFQVQDGVKLAKDIRAWGWSLKDLRQSGGKTIANTKHYSVDKDVDVAVVYVAPNSHSDAFEEAQAVFQSLNVDAHPTTDAGPIAARARHLLQAQHS